MRKVCRVAALLSLAAMLACSSGSGQKPATSAGFRTLDAVVVERSTQGGGGYQGAMVYVMGFETKDGDVTTHLQYEVTRDQYMRFPEGTHVKLLLADDRLRDIKPGD